VRHAPGPNLQIHGANFDYPSLSVSIALFNSNDEEVQTFDSLVRTIDSTLIAIKAPTITSTSALKATFKLFTDGKV